MGLSGEVLLLLLLLMVIIMKSMVLELYGSKYTFDYQCTIHSEREGLKIGHGGKCGRLKIGKYERVRTRRVVVDE